MAVPAQEFDSEKFRKDLTDYLAEKSNPGSFSYWNRNLSVINPGLHIRGLGSVALPIHDAEAARIIPHARKAPYGKGTETIIDEDVRKTWEIDARDIAMENSKYGSWLKTVLESAKQGLGLKTESGVREELYKLLIYGEGAHFKPHRDTEKVPGMFGTLVVCLPSQHEGGDIRLVHGKEERVYSTAAPVISGYRVVLTYNLILDDPSFRPSASTDNDELLKRLVDSYVDAVDEEESVPPELIYQLKHMYTEANMCVELLKLSDKEAALSLRKAAGSRCDIYLALLERQVEGACDDGDPHWRGGGTGEMYDINSDIITLKQITTFDGDVIIDEIEAGEDSFIQDDIYEDRDPDDEENEGYTGNEGGSATHWYRDAVLVIVPRRLAFMFSVGPKLQNFDLVPPKIDSLLQEIKGAGTQRDGAAIELETICGQCVSIALQHLKTVHAGGFQRSIFECLLKGCAATGKCDLFAQAMKLVDERAPPVCFDTVGRYFHFDEKDREICLDSVRRAIAKQKSPASRYEALDMFCRSCPRSVNPDFPFRHLNKDNPPWLSAFLNSGIELVIEALPNKTQLSSLKMEDGCALIAIVSKVDQPDLQTRVLNKVGELTSNSAFAVGMLLEMCHSCRVRDPASGSELGEALNRFYENTLHEFNLSGRLNDPASLSWRERMTIGYGSNWPSSKTEHSEHNSKIAQATGKLYVELMGLDMSDENSLLSALAADAERYFTAYHHETFIVPFVRSLLQNVEEKQLQDKLNQDRFHRFCQRVVIAYLLKAVGPKPAEPRNWVRARVKCTCGDCSKLNSFLAHPTQKTARFPLAERRRKHLSNELCYDRNEVYDETTDKSKPPYTLVISKTRKAHEQKVQHWRSAAQRVENDLKQLGISLLRTLLGPNFFVGGMFNVERLPWLIDPQAMHQPLAARSENGNGTKRTHDSVDSDLAGKRQRVDIVDLT